jgi:PST family polysaccharide transporter
VTERLFEAVGQGQRGFNIWFGVRLPVLPPVVWLTAGRVTQQALSLILFAVLAPILGPRPYGVFAIVMVFVGFCEFILFEGAVEALVTIEKLDHKHTTAANRANCLVAIALGAAVTALAPSIASAMHESEIRNVIWALAPMPLLSSLSAVPVAVLRRMLRYRELALRSILGLTIGGVFGIVLAFEGAGVWALVLQVLAQRVAELVIAWIAVPVRFGVSWSAPHFRELRPVALNVFAARTMSMLSGQFPRLALGYTLGATDVGLLALGNKFLEIIVHTTVVPRTAIGRIELKSERIGSLEFERDFRKMVRNASLIAFPFSLGTAALLPQLFHLWLNKDWHGGIVPTQLLVLSSAPMVLFYCFDAALLAGNLSSVFRKIANLQGVTVAVTVLLAAPFGLTVTCLALALRPLILLPVTAVMFRSATGIAEYKALLPSVNPMVGAVVMAILLSLPLTGPIEIPGALKLIVQVVGGIMVYVAYLYLFARNDLRQLLAGVSSRFL